MTAIKRAIQLTGILAIVLLAQMPLAAQDRCGTVEVLEKKRNRSAVLETDEGFEKWIKQRASLRKGGAGRSGAYTIPVVFHVIHKGEAVGSGTNIPDAQLTSQIAVLNRDYNRLNKDASSTPTEFVGVAGNIAINFVLARQDPNGNPTSGIVRVKGSKNTWTTDDESTLKATSYWPAENYLNIWVTDLSSTLLGYAQFPISDLAGLEDAEDNRLTDGVVVDYSVVGSNEDGTFNLTTNFNKGRSATHEVGHFFGLRHIWGDDNGSCAGSGDYVDDTPNQGNNTSGCPSNPQTSCGVHSMFQNYMDYTNDACMNLFTNGQVSRMITVIENSPRRASLLISPGAEDPSPVANDIALMSIETPGTIGCDASVLPVVHLTNNGTNAVNKLALQFASSGDTVVTSLTLSESLHSSGSTAVTLNAVELMEGEQSMTVTVVSVNGAADGKQRDNTVTGSTYLRYREAIPYREDFGSDPSKWRLSDAAVAWTTATANDGSATNVALKLTGYGTGESDTAVATTPMFKAQAAKYLVFDVAYAQASGSDPGRLSIYAMSKCSDDLSTARLVYDKSGATLATAPVSSTSYAPSGALQWRQEVVELSVFDGMDEVRFAIVGMKAGNNIYVDNFQVVAGAMNDAVIADVREFGPVTCKDQTSVALVVANHGSVTLTSMQIRYSVNGTAIDIGSFSNLSVEPGATTQVTLQGIPASQPTNAILFELLRPNGLFDTRTENNTLDIAMVVNRNSDIIPGRERFENGIDTWATVAPYGGSAWATSTTDQGGSMAFHPDNATTTRSSWLASPALDLETATEASVFFDVSRLPDSLTGLIDSRADSSDTLSVMVSTDCGASYEKHKDIPLSYNAIDINTPASQSHWTRKFVNLSHFAGSGNVRVALVLEHSASRVYIDNIEFFLSADSTPVATDQPFTVYGTDPSSPGDFLITFNLPERSNEVSYSILDMTGRSLMTTQLTEVLNQTYQVQPPVSAGVYLLRVRIGSHVYTNRVFIEQ